MALFVSGVRSPRLLLQLGFVTSLIALNRQDALLLVLPALLYTCYGLPWRTVGLRLALGFLPLILWEMFSLFYYGFPFPNTAYAKLNTGIAAGVLIAQGLSYLINSLRSDPLTLAVCAAALALTLVRRNRTGLLLASGMLLYILYTVKVGGDFMSGRFLSAPFFLACAVLSQERWRLRSPSWVAALLLILGLGFASPNPPLLSQAEFGADRAGLFDENGVADERAFYYRRTGLLKAGRAVRMPDVAPGYLNPPYNEYGMIVQHNVGMMGFFGTRRDVYILDDYALSDPLLARLPVTGAWRIGHFKREIPPGYIETLGTGTNRIVDEGLAAYYDSIQTITRSPLFSVARLREVVLMNLGLRDHLLDSYLDTLR
jgi:arabinofuranosyltransferase